MAMRFRNRKPPALLKTRRQNSPNNFRTPVASLISVPFQSNFDFNMGPNDDGFNYTLNFQPVIPISLGKDYNLIIRTIVPIISQDDVIPGTSQSRLGDIVQSFFLTEKPAAAKIISLMTGQAVEAVEFPMVFGL